MSTAANRQEYFISVLLQSRNYREFLAQAFEYLKDSKNGFSLTALARKAGCRSKSYPREVMTGRRSLSFDYAPGFATAFGLKGDAKKLFLKFVELERSAEKTPLESEISELKQRIKNRVEHSQRKPQDVFAQGLWIDLYAALGSIEKGATIEEISNRTGLRLPIIKSTLNQMMEKDLVGLHTGTGCFYPKTLHHFFENADQDQIFGNRYLDLLKRVEGRAKTSMRSETELFQCSTISLLEKDLPRLKLELREVLQRFVQDAEYAEGDRLAHLVVGMIT